MQNKKYEKEIRTHPLFKFSRAEGAIAILKGQSLFVTSPLDLNDPFEMRPAWTNEHQRIANEDSRQRDRLLSRADTHIAEPDGRFTRTKIAFQPESEPVPVDVNNHRGVADSYNQNIFSDLDSKFRLLCFSQSLFEMDQSTKESEETSTLMWSHYCDQFRGVCIVFDRTKLNPPAELASFDVSYEGQRPSLPPEYYRVYCTDAHDPRSGLYLTEETRREQFRKSLIDCPRALTSAPDSR